MNTADYDYPLPPELIAQEPLPDRSASRLMVVHRQTGQIEHQSFASLPQYLRPGDLLVLNNTKVIPARIWSANPRVELLLLENLGNHCWSALVKPGRRARVGGRLEFDATLHGEVERETDFGGRVIRFAGDVDAFLESHGVPPLPPYINRPATAADRERYQTVYADQPGAVAAPTAGLHFTSEMLSALPHTFITLHVGLGTFRPVKAERIENHKMHSERFSVTATAAAAMQQAHRIIAVGTTVVRTLESLGEPRAGHGTTDIFIHPPFAFRMTGALLTNFHLPRSTLLMLVSAFAGRELILEAYAAAVRGRYRFFSYGDAMLIL